MENADRVIVVTPTAASRIVVRRNEDPGRKEARQRRFVQVGGTRPRSHAMHKSGCRWSRILRFESRAGRHRREVLVEYRPLRAIEVHADWVWILHRGKGWTEWTNNQKRVLIAQIAV